VRLINSLQQAGFLGIDLTSAEAKPSACLGLDGELKLIYSGFLHQDSDILKLVSRYGIELVAIDAPLSLPQGLCCLEESCPCQPANEVKGRSCERELARLGSLATSPPKNLLLRLWFIAALDLRLSLKL